MRIISNQRCVSLINFLSLCSSDGSGVFASFGSSSQSQYQRRTLQESLDHLKALIVFNNVQNGCNVFKTCLFVLATHYQQHI